MPDRPRVFVDVDTQRDFLEPGGALYLADTPPILQNLARLTSFARQHDIPVIATACAHTLDQPDPEPFPPHCVVGTRGQERVDATAWPGTEVIRPEQRGPGTIRPHITIEKRWYDMFSHADSDRILDLYGHNHPRFVVYGVATDYCVRVAVFGLLARGYNVALVVDAIRAVEPAREPEELTAMARRGALLTLTDVVCQGD